MVLKAVLARNNKISVRLARSESEVRAAQRLRYRVFYQEQGAHPSAEAAELCLDADGLDRYCDHIMVFDGEDECVGVCRLLRAEVARQTANGFYTSSEFDISPLLDLVDGELAEIGRLCVASSCRSGEVLHFLWRGVAIYLAHYGVSTLFGCVSFHGVDVKAIKPSLAYIHRFHMAPEELRPRALPQCRVDINVTPEDNVDSSQRFTLPPLVKCYLNMGTFFGDGAVIDRQFNTIDACAVMRASRLPPRCFKRYHVSLDRGALASRSHLGGET